MLYIGFHNKKKYSQNNFTHINIYHLNYYKDYSYFLFSGLLFPFLLFYVYEHFISFCIQGFVEDQFGLGLIARAVEEGISVIKPSGIMVFNMGGRPGQGVCQRLFERRGFRITKLWQTKIMQVLSCWALPF